MKTVVISHPQNGVLSPNEIPIGAWLFQGYENRYHDLTIFNFPSIFEHKHECSKASLCSYEYARKIIENLVPHLNEVNKFSYSNRFWERIIGGWVHLLIQVVYVRYEYIVKFLETHQGEMFKVQLTQTDYRWPFKDTHEFATTTSKDNFDVWLTSVILEQLSPSNWIFEEKGAISYEISEPVSHVVDDRNPKATTLYGKIRKSILDFIEKEDRFSVSGANWKSRLFMNLFFRYFYKLEKNTAVNQKHIPTSLSHDLSECIDFVIKQTMPEIFTNGYIREIIEKNNHFYRRNRIRIVNPDIYKEEAKIMNAFAAENGEVLVSSQHGSTYGVINCISPSHAVEFESDYFITWGWQNYWDFVKDRFIALPSPLLGLSLVKNRKQSDNIIFFDKMYNLRSARLSGQPFPHQLIIERKMRFDFFNDLGSEVKMSMLYRPHVFHANGLDDSEYFARHGIKVFDSKSYDELVQKILGAKLLILNHYGTTLHQSLAWNVPTVCYWDPVSTDIHPAARDVFDALLEAHIVFHDYKEAAQHVNNIYSDINGWWCSDKVQSARKAFCQNHAYTKKYWLFDWLKFLILDLKHV